MNDDTYSGDLHPWIEPEIEARVVALILGEASDFEAGELERLMEERPEVRIFKRRLEAVHGLVGEAMTPKEDAEWRLPDEKRRELLEKIGAAPEEEAVPVMEANAGNAAKERRIRKAGRRVLWSAAACFVLTLFLVALIMSSRIGEQAVPRLSLEKAGYSEERMVPLDTEIPPALLEGTPKPIRVPGLTENRSGPVIASRSARPEARPSAPPPPAEEPSVVADHGGVREKLARLRSQSWGDELAVETAVEEADLDYAYGTIAEGRARRSNLGREVDGEVAGFPVQPADGPAVAANKVVPAKMDKEQGQVDALATSQLALRSGRMPEETGKAVPELGDIPMTGSVFSKDAPAGADDSVVWTDPEPTAEEAPVDAFGVDSAGVEGAGSGGREAEAKRAEAERADSSRMKTARPGVGGGGGGMDVAVGGSIGGGTDGDWMRNGDGLSVGEDLPEGGERFRLEVEALKAGASFDSNGRAAGSRNLKDAKEGADSLSLVAGDEATGPTPPSSVATKPVSGPTGQSAAGKDLARLAPDESAPVPEPAAPTPSATPAAPKAPAAKPGAAEAPKGAVRGEELADREAGRRGRGLANAEDSRRGFERSLEEAESLTAKAERKESQVLEKRLEMEEELPELRGGVRLNELKQLQKQLAEVEEVQEQRDKLAARLDRAAEKPARPDPGLAYESGGKGKKARDGVQTGDGAVQLGLREQEDWKFNHALRDDQRKDGDRRGPADEQMELSDHDRIASDQDRAALLGEVDATWEMEGRLDGERSGEATRGGGNEFINNKLANIVIPEVDFEDTTVEEAMDFLRQRVRELDASELDPAKKGLNLVLRKPRIERGAVDGTDEDLDAEDALGAVDTGSARIKSLKLKNVPLKDALQAVAEAGNLRFEVDDYAVKMVPRGEAEGEDLLTRSWSVSRGALRALQDGEVEEKADPFASGTGGVLKARRPVVDRFKDLGVDFPDGASMFYLPESETLVVRNTPANLDLVEKVAEDLQASEPAVEPDADLFARQSFGGGEDDGEARAKLRGIQVPMVDFDDVTVGEAVTFFESKLAEARTPEGEPVELDLQVRNGEVEDRRIDELKLRNVPLETALGYVAEAANLKMSVSGGQVTLQAPGAATERFETKSWFVSPEVVDRLRDHVPPRQSATDESLQGLLEEAGIDFPEGSSVQFLPEAGTLVVKNRRENLEMVDYLFEDVAVQLTKERNKSRVIEESLEKSAEAEPFSTFSLHVSDVSFKLAKASLDQGQWPPAGQLRVEEFVNAFDYKDPAPTQAEKVACTLEQAVHPFMQQRNLMRISMRTAALGRAGGVPLRLTVLVDNSGSMEREDRAESVRNAFDLLAAQLQPQDQVTLISFARTPRLLADRMTGEKAGTLSQLVDAIPAEGGTNLEEALRLGVTKAAEQHLEGGQNRIILLTDGAANLGNAKPGELAKLVEEMRGKGIAFDACGVGAEGLNDEILESLTRKGDGRYYFLDRPEDADEGFAKQIAGALRPAARNVKVQVQFNPKRVGRYKLYGFEKHRLKKEDFRNDSVDAAEMAAEEAGNAVYQFEVLPEGEGEIGTVSVRFQDTNTGQMVEKKWTIPHEPGAARLEEAAPSMRLAAGAAFLGEALNGSALGELVDLDVLARLVTPLQTIYPQDDRVMQLVGMTAKARELASK